MADITLLLHLPHISRFGNLISKLQAIIIRFAFLIDEDYKIKGVHIQNIYYLKSYVVVGALAQPYQRKINNILDVGPNMAGKTSRTGISSDKA